METLDLCQPCSHALRCHEKIQSAFYQPPILNREDCPPIHLSTYEDIHEAREHIGHFIRQVYHQKRPHSGLDYLTPLEFQRKNLS